MSRVAHRIEDGQMRTRDVVNDDNFNVDFASLLLSPVVQAGLTSAGFERPSPIQLKAIPLGRCGLDLIVQAKSGTGKTCVFGVIALEGLDVQSRSTQVLVLAPTREIAVQIHEVILSIGSTMKGLCCHAFIGGTLVGPDRQKLKKCHIAIGTPGRVKQLIEFGVLRTESIRLFVLDEADKLLDHQFKEQVNWIYNHLTENKQMLAVSATYPEYLAKQLTTYMRDPMFVRLNRKDVALHGIKQFYKVVPGHHLTNKAFEVKVEHLIQILSQVAFNQCLVFSNLQTRAQNLSDMLNFKGWPSTYISGHQEQAHRMSAMAMLKKFQCRILISTDLTARGIDAENVNLIVNLDVPYDEKTYYHRIGRAGRFGTQGAAITLASTGQEEIHLANIKKHGKMSPLPEPLPADLLTLAQDSEHLSSLSSSSESESGDYLNDQSQLMTHSNLVNQSGLKNDQPSAVHSIGSSSGMNNDQNSSNQAPKPPRRRHQLPGVDKGCQVKPSFLSAILGTDFLEHKIRPLSNNRTKRASSERWTYEKAKRDYEIFLDPSKAPPPPQPQVSPEEKLPEDTVLSELPLSNACKVAITENIQMQVPEDKTCLKPDISEQDHDDQVNGTADEIIPGHHNSILEKEKHETSETTPMHETVATKNSIIKTDEVAHQLQSIDVNREHLELKDDCAETSKLSAHGIENDTSPMQHGDEAKRMPTADAATVYIPLSVPAEGGDHIADEVIRPGTKSTTENVVTKTVKQCQESGTQSHPTGATVHKHMNHFGIGHTLSLIAKQQDEGSISNDSLKVDHADGDHDGGKDPVWESYMQYLTHSDAAKKLPLGGDTETDSSYDDGSTYTDEETSSSSYESTSETCDSTSSDDTDSESQSDDEESEADLDGESREVTGESEQCAEDEEGLKDLCTGLHDMTFAQYGNTEGQGGHGYWNDGQLATWQNSIDGYYRYPYWQSTEYSAHMPYNQCYYPQSYQW